MEDQPKNKLGSFYREEKCKHPLQYLRVKDQDNARGARAQVVMICGVCDQNWNGPERSIAIMLNSLKGELFKD